MNTKLPREHPEMMVELERLTYRNKHFGVYLYEYITPSERTHRWACDALPERWFATYEHMWHAVTCGLNSLFSLKLSGEPMKIGQTQQLRVVAMDAAGNVITDATQLAGIGYTDDASDVANVDASGVVTAKKLGTADFTATITNSEGTVITSNEVTLTVGAGDIASLTLTADPAVDPAPATPAAPGASA